MLDKKSLDLLKKFKKSTLTCNQIADIVNDDYQKYTNRLFKMKMIISVADDNKEFLGYTISLDGIAYLEEQSHHFWAFLFPYVITTLIAIASVIVSVFALCP